MRLNAVALVVLVNLATLAPALRAQTGDTLLHEAVGAGDRELIDYLRDNGAAVYRRA